MADNNLAKYENLSKKIYGSYIDVDSAVNTVTNYTKLAETYEKDFVGLGYETPNCVAETAASLLTEEALKNGQILDVACGTGLVSDGLRCNGFKGSLDGVDGSEGMLKIAKEKAIYRHLKEQFVLPDKPIAFPDNTYDAVVCCGGFGPGHLQPEVLNDFIRVTKPRGVIVFTTRDNKSASTYVEHLSNEVESLLGKNLWKKEKVFQSPYFCYDAASSAKTGKQEPLWAVVYCYTKL